MKQKERKHFGFRCLGPNIDEKKILRLQEELGSKKFIKSFNLLKVLCGNSRFKILYLLIKEEKLCVCDLADILGTSLSNISHQLKVLKEKGIVIPSRSGKTIFYSLKPEWQEKFKKLFL